LDDLFEESKKLYAETRITQYIIKENAYMNNLKNELDDYMKVIFGLNIDIHLRAETVNALIFNREFITYDFTTKQLSAITPFVKAFLQQRYITRCPKEFCKFAKIILENMSVFTNNHIANIFESYVLMMFETKPIQLRYTYNTHGKNMEKIMNVGNLLYSGYTRKVDKNLRNWNDLEKELTRFLKKKNGNWTFH